MTKVSAIQTYNIDVNPDIYMFGNNFTLYDDNDDCFKLHFQKIHTDSHSIKTFDGGFANVFIKVTAYPIVISDDSYNPSEFVSGKVSFTLDLGKVKISDLKGTFEVETSDNAPIDFDLNFNPKLSQKDKNFFTKQIAEIIGRADFKVNIEQTVSEIEFIEK